MPFVKKCPFLRQKIEEDVCVLDYRLSGLIDLPSEVFDRERTLEELYADSNQIRELPRELFCCQGLRKLSFSDNEITDIPSAISSLANLQELDFSKNGIIEVPDSIKSCKYLRSVDASVNPLGKLPEVFTHLANLTHLYLNDTYLDYLPGSFGRMTSLKILELRENHLKTLPRSFNRLVLLEKLDIGNNELTELSDVLGGLASLLELWCDNNQITFFANNIGSLKHLMFLDASNNQVWDLPKEIEGCTSLADLHLTSNNIVKLPCSIGNLVHLTTLKVDDNYLTCLPETLGRLSSLSELNISSNDITQLPVSIGLLRNLRTLYADENLLQWIPAEIGSCNGITVLSLRSNKLTYIPDELGRIPGLRVLNLSDNLLQYLPFSIVKLKELQALWLAENQTHPLIPLQSEYDADTNRKILTCYLLPQGLTVNNEPWKSAKDTKCSHASLTDGEKSHQQQIHFDFTDSSEEGGCLVRCPTPHPRDIRHKVRHAHNLALRQMINAEDDMVKHDICGDKHQTMENFNQTKLKKYKTCMQHRLSAPDCGSSINMLSREARRKHSNTGDITLPSGISLSGSVPDLTTFADEASLAGSVRSVCSKHNNKLFTTQRRRRMSRQSKEYDSDTGYRSDGDIFHVPVKSRGLFCLNPSSDRFSVHSQPLPQYSNQPQQQYNTKDRKGLGIVSNTEYFPGHRSYPTANAAAAAFQRQHLTTMAAHNMSQNIHRAPQSSTAAGMSMASHPIRTWTLQPDITINLQLDEALTCKTGDNSEQFETGFSSNSSTSSHAIMGAIVSNNQLYEDQPGNNCLTSPQENITSFNHSVLKMVSLNKSKREQSHTRTEGFLAGYEQASSSAAEHMTINLSHQQASASLQSQVNVSHSLSAIAATNAKLKSQNERKLSIQSNPCAASLTPMLNSKCMEQTSGMFIQPVSSVKDITSSPQPLKGNRAAEQGTVTHSVLATLKERPQEQTFGSPPLFISIPSNQRPSSSSSQPYINRLSNEASSSNSESPLSTSNISVAKGDASLASLCSGIQKLSLTHSLSSCGFHGSHPFSNCPRNPNEPLQSPQHIDVDDMGPGDDHDGGQTRTMQVYQDNNTTKSGSSSSHLGSTSQVGYKYSAGIQTQQFSVDHPNSSTSSSHMHNYLGPYVYSPTTLTGSSWATVTQEIIYNNYLKLLDKTCDGDLTRITNQERCSHMSSSTDSGYSHGHSMYERFGDNHKGRNNSKTQEKRHMPMETFKNTGQINTKSVRAISDFVTQEHIDQFYVKIQKHPELGFSIAGGIGSKGNPYRENDDGIFVTNVSPLGPAWRVLLPGDKILEVNQVNFQAIEHSQAVSVLKNNKIVHLLIERIQKVNLV